MHERPRVRTLLADNDPAVLDALVGLFASAATIEIVATATSGDELLDAIARYSPELVVTDVYMPSGGEALFDRLAALDGRPIVVAASGMASPTLRRRITPGGADILLHKGVDDPLAAALDVLSTSGRARR